MKIFKNILIVVATLSFAFTLESCKDFLDVNDNPNDPSFSTPGLTLPVAQRDFARINSQEMTYLGNYMVANWATPSNWSANADLFRYTVTSDFFVSVFENSYSSIFKNLTYIENYVDASGAVDYSSYQVISKVLKGFQYQYLVDLYGDVPYSEANRRGELRSPKYDKAEDVYKAIISSLTEAANLALNLPTNAENPGTQDIMFGGDMQEWAKFANTVKLRMLVRLSNTSQEAYIKEQIAAINANGAGFIDHTVYTNPGYSDNTDKQSPFYAYFVQPATGAQTNRQDYTVASAHIISYLNGTNDERMLRLFKPAQTGGAFKGALQSTSLPGTGFTSNDLSKVGPGLLKSSGQDQPVMLLSEAELLQAEAITRGYMAGTADDAKAFYESAIENSFIELGVPDASAAAAEYYEQEINNVGWEFSQDKIEAIITQKWVALNGTSSIESWIELTRTGFPKNLPLPAESPGMRPVRLLYPVSEIARNSKNVPSQTAQDSFTKNPFWK